MTSEAGDVLDDGTVPVLCHARAAQGVNGAADNSGARQTQTVVDISKCFFVLLCVYTLHSAFVRGFVDIVKAHTAVKGRVFQLTSCKLAWQLACGRKLTEYM